MGRPEKLIDIMKGPLAQFGADLKMVRHRAGTPTYEVMAAETGLSVGALSEAALGESCPSWRTLSAYLRFCGVDPQDWRPRWEMLASAEQRLQAGFPVRREQRQAMLIMDPKNIRTIEDFVLGLWHLRCTSGYPPLKAIASRSNRGISTISTMLAPGRGKLPTLDLLESYLMAFDLPSAKIAEWRSAWYFLMTVERQARTAA
ncbi:helix-turn-helix domain-containing protein [Kitasatospora sp. NRRL B-11411]|uniref:helix-turn-helix domain-containing protein n=1 Tax=Kitasatospora sp. NRRL B-11411 TaxID=1463822 RepID=UPI0012FE9CD6|nr:helix-turn-helix transcriptional regulator [Kitasatospora sp. NRRL B-11411]